MGIQATDNAAQYLLLLEEGLDKLDAFVLAGEEVDQADCYLMAQEQVTQVTETSTYLASTLRIRLLNEFLLEFGFKPYASLNGIDSLAD